MLRRSRGMRQADLADKAGVSPTAVTDWETGKSLPSEKTVVGLAAALGTTIDYLLTGREPGRAEALFAMEQKMREAEAAGCPVPHPDEEAVRLRRQADEMTRDLANKPGEAGLLIMDKLAEIIRRLDEIEGRLPPPDSHSAPKKSPSPRR